MKKILSVPAVTLLAVGTLISCSAPSDDSSDPEPTVGSSAERTRDEQPGSYKHYVALGDSYAAMGSQEAETSGPTECFRSADNYPSVVAEHEQIESFIDVTCSSAVTMDITTTRAGNEEPIPPQLESLTEDTDLVTISIGGNDIGFPEIAACFQEAIATGEESDCASRFNRDELFGSIRENLVHVYSNVQQRSPNADIYVTGYMPLITDEGECTDAAFISENDRGWAVSITNELNGRIKGVASSMQIPFVLPKNAEEHTVCASAEERWTDLTGQVTGAYPMHPTALGQTAMAEAITAKL